jgi:colanic acid/amylovoran biosynthesis protein
MAALVEHVRASGYEPVMFAHVQGPGAHEMDRDAIDECCSALPGAARPVVVDGDFNCRELKAMYGLMAAMVGTRFHSCIFALSERVPTMAIEYQGYKASGIMSEIGLEDYVISIGDASPARMCSTFDRMIADAVRIRERCDLYNARIGDEYRRLTGRVHGVGPRHAGAFLEV